MLARHFDRLETFSAFIGSSTWNWDHPQVQKLLKDIMTIDSNEIHQSIRDNNIAILEFASKTYKQIYG